MYYDKNNLILLYNGNREKDRKTLAMALSITTHVDKQELNSVRFSETLFCKMLDKLGVEPKSILNKSLPVYQEQFRGRDLTSTDWYNAIRRYPDLLLSPIAMFKDKAVICNTPTDVYKVLNREPVAA